MKTEEQRIAIGDRFGRLLIVGPSPRLSPRNKRWACICDCGNKKAVGQGELTSGKTKSCGCLRRELTAKNRTTHGNARRGKHSREYRIWRGIISRCTLETNPAWSDYGGRGITVCERWLNSFETFLADMGRCPTGMSIERKHNDGGYHPGNCVWATAAQQAKNRRPRRWKKKP